MSVSAATRRWWVMAVIGIAELMVTLDNSIVNIALPSAQADLGFRDTQRSWVVTAYALAFGSLLLLGGRLADLLGRRRAFLLGLLGFAVASVLGGLAPNFSVLVTARALQGAFGALLAPAALSLLTTTFPAGRERARAFGVFATLAVSGSAIGMLLGGCSPSTSTGAGACTSTWPSPPPGWSVPPFCCRPRPPRVTPGWTSWAL